MTTETIETRWLIRRDTPAVVDIEQRSFGDPWDENDFITVLKNRDVIGMVIEVDGEVCGYCIYKLLNKGLEIINIAVKPIDRRRGLGARMVQKLIGKLSKQNRTTIQADVMDCNLRAQLFLQSLDFNCVDIIKGDDEHYRFMFFLDGIQRLM